MAFTSVVVSGTAQYDSGEACPYAVVTFSLDEDMVNGSTTASGGQAIASSSGTWSITVDATDDSSTTTQSGVPALYNISIVDPNTNEQLFSQRSAVPHAVTSITVGSLVASGAPGD